MREKLRLTHMEMLGENLPQLTGCKNLDALIKECRNELGTIEEQAFYFYVACKSAGIPIKIKEDGGLQYNQAIAVKRMILGTDPSHPEYLDHIHKAIENMSLDFRMYDILLRDKKIFKFREGLIKKLMATKLNNVTTHFLKLPFRSMVIVMDTPIPAHHYFRNVVLNVNEIYIYTKTLDDGSINFYLYAYENRGDFHANLRDVFGVGMNFEEGEIIPQLTTYPEALQKLTHFVISALLYLNSSQPELNPIPVTKSPMEKVLRKRGEGNSSIVHQAVGDSITVDREWNSLRIGGSPDSPEKGAINRVTTAWIVRGHWRNQAFGTNRQEKKLIWIEPFIKGKDFSDIKNKMYDVK